MSKKKEKTYLFLSRIWLSPIVWEKKGTHLFLPEASCPAEETRKQKVAVNLEANKKPHDGLDDQKIANIKNIYPFANMK